MCQVPWTVLSKYYNPRIWIGCSAILWGICSTSMVSSHLYSHLTGSFNDGTRIVDCKRLRKPSYCTIGSRRLRSSIRTLCCIIFLCLFIRVGGGGHGDIISPKRSIIPKLNMVLESLLGLALPLLLAHSVVCLPMGFSTSRYPSRIGGYCSS